MNKEMLDLMELITTQAALLKKTVEVLDAVSKKVVSLEKRIEEVNDALNDEIQGEDAL